MNGPKIVITKSTVPVGPRRTVRAEIAELTEAAHSTLLAIPSSSRKGAAIDDFMKPDRVVVGVDSARGGAACSRELYAPFLRTERPFMVMDIRDRPR